MIKISDEWNIRDENYKGKLLFSIKYFVLFGTDSQSMYFMSTIFLKYKINGVCVTQFQLSYIHNTTYHPHTNLVKFCCEVHYMWWWNQDLELQEWEYCIKSNKTRILDNIILVTNKNPHGYIEKVI